MLTYLTLATISIISLLLPLISQPLSFGLILLSTTLFSALFTASIGFSWYGYIIFLIFIGGLLVMFAYVAALAPNSYFKPPRIILSLRIFRLLYLLLASINIILPTPLLTTCFTFYAIKSSTIIYSFPFVPTLFFLIYILLITIVSVAKICSFNIGPLRPYK